MEVTKDNRISAGEWKDDVICESCKSGLTLSLNDLTHVPSTATLDDGHDSYEYFNCGACGNRNYYHGTIPKYLRSAVPVSDRFAGMLFGGMVVVLLGLAVLILIR